MRAAPVPAGSLGCSAPACIARRSGAGCGRGRPAAARRAARRPNPAAPPRGGGTLRPTAALAAALAAGAPRRRARRRGRGAAGAGAEGRPAEPERRELLARLLAAPAAGLGAACARAEGAPVAGASGDRLRRLSEVSAAADAAARMKRLGEDPEVRLLRRLQASVRLFDTARGEFVGLVDVLRPGEKLYDADLVCIGEQHDSDADHTMQRIILDALTHALLVDLRKGDLTTPQNMSPAHKVSVGVEYFYREQNDVLDALIFSGASSKEFLEKSRFQEVWSYDWALYRPLFRYLQLNKTSLVGLNIPMAKVREVTRSGIENVDFRSSLPELDLTVPLHRRRFEDMMQLPVDQVMERMRSPPDSSTNPKLDRMYASQCLWEEYMSQTANGYLQANAGRMVLLAGYNHVWRDAIPDRFERQSARSGSPRRAVSVVPWRWTEADPARLPRFADYLVCMRGAGGGDEVAAAVSAQRARLRTQERVFPAGFV